MANSDKLIKSISEHLYNWYVIGQMDSNFDGDMAKRDSRKIMELVEKYQSSPKITRWRASD